MYQESRKNIAIAGLAVVAILLLSSTLYLALAPGQGNSSTSKQTGQVTTYASPVGFAGQAGNGDSATSNTGSVTPEITVSGTGQVSFTPTEAMVGLSVVTEDTTAGQATAANAAATTAVIKALGSIGIANSSIQTTSYDVSPNYNYNNQGQPPTILGYTVTNSLRVNVTGTSPAQLGVRAGQVIDTGVGEGANQVNLQFTVPNSMMMKLNNQALQQAVSVASGEAQTIASALGVSITGVISASAGSYSSPQPVYAVANVPGAAVGATPIVPGTMIASASVQVTYGIG